MYSPKDAPMRRERYEFSQGEIHMISGRTATGLWILKSDQVLILQDEVSIFVTKHLGLTAPG
jgi:hypothetical protein